MDVHTAYWVMVVLAAIPTPLLFLTWLGRLSPSGSVNAFRRILLITATGSYVWLVLAMIFPRFLAESYTRSRFAIIDGNFIVMVGCSIAAFRGTERLKGVFGLACVLTTMMWGVLGAINAVV
ncbi:MAG: hypothetical protein ACHQKY_15255 [Terriglobia bacterium]